jgi:hypothetical protein
LFRKSTMCLYWKVIAAPRERRKRAALLDER